MVTFVLLNVIVNHTTNNNSDLIIVTGSDLPSPNPYKCVESLEYLNNSFIICLKDPILDKFVSAVFNSYERYDPLMMSDFLSAINQFPDAYVIDIGCNLGPYTMLASSTGHDVIAVDPLPENHALLYNSIVLNGVDHIVTQVMNSVSDEHSSFFAFQEEAGNPGNTLMVKANNLQADKANSVRKGYQIKSVLFQQLLDLIPSNLPVVIKMDVEGYECKVLQKFLSGEDKSHFVPVIMMETVTLCSPKGMCPEFKTHFIPALQMAGYKAFTPQPVSYQDFSSSTDYNYNFNSIT